jgi:MFS family permease
MAFQSDAAGLNFWRLMTGIGLGVELVTIDAYLSELVPSRVRGRAFALNQVITYSAVPVVSFLAWRLVPLAPFGGLIILCGCLVAIGATVMSLNFHAYQSELYPTRIRALAVGFVYSASRISGAFSGFLVSFALTQKGVPGALALIAGCMGIVALSIGLLGPRTRGRSLEALALDGDATDAPAQSIVYPAT